MSLSNCFLKIIIQKKGDTDSFQILRIMQNKSVPMTFMTKKPVSITLTNSEGEKQNFERLYIDDKSLETIMEFMKE